MNAYCKGLFLVCIVSLISACQPEQATQKMHQKQLFSFGTLIDISIVTDDALLAQQTIDHISQTFDVLHKQWHPWQDGDLGQVNQSFSVNKEVSPPVSIMQLIQSSQQLSEQSNGLFNPAIGQLIKLWQFDQLENEHYQFHLPDAQKINKLVSDNPQMSDIIIDKAQLKSQKATVSLDFGAFAKGVAIENMIDIVKQSGLTNALINAGGDLKVIGTKNGKAWRIGIKNPAQVKNPSAQAIIAAIDLHDNEALFTSGNYERFFTVEGKHYHHIIDPRTGYPAQGTQSVTVLSSDAALADAASTALFIAGPDLWVDIAKKMGITSVMLIAEDNTLYLSSAMAKRIKLLTEVSPVIVALD